MNINKILLFLITVKTSDEKEDDEKPSCSFYETNKSKKEDDSKKESTSDSSKVSSFKKTVENFFGNWWFFSGHQGEVAEKQTDDYENKDDKKEQDSNDVGDEEKNDEEEDNENSNNNTDKDISIATKIEKELEKTEMQIEQTSEKMLKLYKKQKMLRSFKKCVEKKTWIIVQIHFVLTVFCYNKFYNIHIKKFPQNQKLVNQMVKENDLILKLSVRLKKDVKIPKIKTDLPKNKKMIKFIYIYDKFMFL